MGVRVQDKDDLLEPQLVVALEATGVMFPHMDLFIQHYAARDRRSIAGNPLGRMSCNDTSLPPNRRGRGKIHRLSKTILKVEEFWETMYEWGLLTPYWTKYWTRRQQEGKRTRMEKAQPLNESG